MKKMKRLASLLLALCLVCLLFPAGAFAEDLNVAANGEGDTQSGTVDTAEEVNVTAKNSGTATGTVNGPVTDGSVTLLATSSGTATAVINGDVEKGGLDVTAMSSGKAAVTVDGDVEQVHNGGQYNTYGVSVSMTSGGESTATVTGKVIGYGTGVDVDSVMGDNNLATINTGNVNVEGRYGVDAMISSGTGTIMVNVGDVTVQGADVNNGSFNKTTIGVSATNWGTGKIDITAGNITLYEDENLPVGFEYETSPAGVHASTIGKGETTITVNDITSDVNGVSVDFAGAGKTTVTAGDIEACDIAVDVSAEGKGTASVTAGELTAMMGINAAVKGGAEVNVEADGIDAYIIGITASVTESGKATIETGDIQSGAIGMQLQAVQGAVSVTADDLTAESMGVLAMAGVGLRGRSTSDDDAAPSTIELNLGNVESGGEEGMLLMAYGKDTSITAQTKDVTGEMAAVAGVASNGASLEITTVGDLTGTAEDLSAGLVIGAALDGTADVVVDGTISGATAGIGIVDESDPDAIALTVWAVELNDEGQAVQTVNMDGADYAVAYDELAQTVEAAINYIIRVVQSDGAQLSVTDENGAALAQVRDQYEVAHEGDKVLLNVDVDANHRLVAAYNGLDGNKVALIQDANGQYYVVVPRGGGVVLSVELEELLRRSKLLGEVSGTDAIFRLSFFENGTYIAWLKGVGAESGRVKMQDGKLQLVSNWGAAMPIREDGTVAYIYNNDPSMTFQAQIPQDILEMLNGLFA